MKKDSQIKAKDYILFSLKDIDFKKLVESSFSYSEIIRKLRPLSINKNYITGSEFRYLKKRISDLNISTSHFDQGISTVNFRNDKKSTNVLNVDFDRIFNVGFQKNSYLKNLLLKFNLKENKCEICNTLPVWNNKKLILQLDHINGNNIDNRIENLRLLCPNCHSQTLTFGSRSKTKQKVLQPQVKKCINCNKYIDFHNKQSCMSCISKNAKVKPPKKRNYKKHFKGNISKDDLLNDLKTDLGIMPLAKKYNISDNGYRKYLKRHNLPITREERKAYRDNLEK